MKDIDFIPPSYRAGRKRKRNLAIRATVIGVFVLVMAGTSLVFHARTAAARSQLDQLRASFEGQGGAIKILTEMKAELAQLQAKRQLLADVSGGAPMHGVLAELSYLVPEALAANQMRLVKGARRFELEALADGNGTKKSGPVRPTGKVELLGWAASDNQVGDLMENMDRSRLFEQVDLHYSRPVEIEDVKAREFRVSCKLPEFE